MRTQLITQIAAILSFFCFSRTAFASTADSIAIRQKITHHVQFLIGNYLSESFTPKYVNTWPSYFAPPVQNFNINYQYNKPILLPMYSYALGFEYKVNFSQRFGLRLGLNYFTYGYLQ